MEIKIERRISAFGAGDLDKASGLLVGSTDIGYTYRQYISSYSAL